MWARVPRRDENTADRAQKQTEEGQKKKTPERTRRTRGTRRPRVDPVSAICIPKRGVRSRRPEIARERRFEARLASLVNPRDSFQGDAEAYKGDVARGRHPGLTHRRTEASSGSAGRPPNSLTRTHNPAPFISGLFEARGQAFRGKWAGEKGILYSKKSTGLYTPENNVEIQGGGGLLPLARPHRTPSLRSLQFFFLLGSDAPKDAPPASACRRCRGKIFQKRKLLKLGNSNIDACWAAEAHTPPLHCRKPTLVMTES
ncbi:hypothetical protein B0H17DRAFT_1154536 [Mycena rosella]|uniref:Uncharacterized protein n=1 Tax=Mycena rosella TaxID=1033263 RepID=A0AAD7F848_MYCRO|nr:hypothetical protein B0H17DRAFT_1154536 [Mycena rosella]